MRPAGVGVVADDAPVAARLQPVDRPFVHLVADRGFGEKDEAVVGDVQVVGQPQPAVIVDGVEAAVRFIRRFLDLAIRSDAVEPHAADADIEIVLTVERHPQRLAADMGEHFHPLVVRREKADDVAMARAGVKIVVAIENHILGRLDAS